MNVTSLSNNSSVQSLSQLYGTQTTDTMSGAAQVTGAYDKPDSVGLSKPGELFSKLQQLQQTDPEKFKQVCADIADKLESASSDSGDKMLSDLAEKFRNVSEGGDISQLQPPPPPNHSGGVQGMIGKYSEQEDQSRVDFIKGQNGGHGPSGEMASLMGSIIDEVDQALQ